MKRYRSKTFPISPLALRENRLFHTFSVSGGKVSGKHVTQGFSPDSSALKGWVTNYSIIDPPITEGLPSSVHLQEELDKGGNDEMWILNRGFLAKMHLFQKASVWKTNQNPGFVPFVTGWSVASGKGFQKRGLQEEVNKATVQYTGGAP